MIQRTTIVIAEVTDVITDLPYPMWHWIIRDGLLRFFRGRPLPNRFTKLRLLRIFPSVASITRYPFKMRIMFPSSLYAYDRRQSEPGSNFWFAYHQQLLFNHVWRSIKTLTHLTVGVRPSRASAHQRDVMKARCYRAARSRTSCQSEANLAQ